MTLDDMKIIAEIIRHADRGCENCVMDLVELCNEKFQDYVFTMKESVYVESEMNWLPVVTVDYKE